MNVTTLNLMRRLWKNPQIRSNKPPRSCLSIEMDQQAETNPLLQDPEEIGPFDDESKGRQDAPDLALLESNEEGGEPDQSNVSLPFGFLAVAISLGLVSGSLYGFGRYATCLRTALQLTQPQAQSLGIYMDTGSYLSHPITGWVYDRWGPRVSCMSAALIVFTSYATIHFSVQESVAASTGSLDSRLLLLSISFAGVGLGSGLGYIAGLGIVASSFPGTWAVGWVAAGYGLSSTLVAVSFHWAGLSRFFLVWAVLVATVNVIGVLVFSSKQTQQIHNEAEVQDEDDSRTADDFEASAELDPTDQSDQVKWKSWRRCDFWLLFIAFGCVTGCGLFVINNVSTLVQSRGIPDSFAGSLVVFLSICNVAGRVVVGGMVQMSQQLNALCVMALLAAAGLGVSAGLGDTVALVSTVGSVAVAYGASWVLVIGVISDWFGKMHFGKDYGVMAMGPALSGLVFNYLSAQFYQEGVEDESGVCMGTVCYQRSFALTAGASTMGCILLLGAAAARRREL